MTLSGHFALKSVLGSAIGCRVLAFRHKADWKFAELRIHWQRQKCSTGILVARDI